MPKPGRCCPGSQTGASGVRARMGGSPCAGLRGMPRGTRRTARARVADESRRAPRPTAAGKEQRSFDKLWARIEASETASGRQRRQDGVVPLAQLAYRALARGRGGRAGHRPRRVRLTTALRPQTERRIGMVARRPCGRARCARAAHRVRAGSLGRDHQHAARAPGAHDRRGPGDLGQFHGGAVGGCRGLGRIGRIRRRGDFEGSECRLRSACRALKHAGSRGRFSRSWARRRVVPRLLSSRLPDARRRRCSRRRKCVRRPASSSSWRSQMP